MGINDIDESHEQMQSEDIREEPCCKQADDSDESCCQQMHKFRSEEEMKSLINRLNRIEGQIRGIKRMVQENAYCIDILNQVSAANSALNSFTKVILSDHIQSCVAEDVRQGNTEKLDELVKTLPKLMK